MHMIFSTLGADRGVSHSRGGDRGFGVAKLDFSTKRLMTSTGMLMVAAAI